MSPSDKSDQEPESYIRTALVVCSFFTLEAQKAGADIWQEVQQNMLPELKKSLTSQADELLRRQKNEILSDGLIETVQKKLHEALGEAKWTKLTLIISQTIGLLGAGLLLKDYDRLPATIIWSFGIYSIGVMFTIGLAVYRSR
jgi:hypothetical protein